MHSTIRRYQSLSFLLVPSSHQYHRTEPMIGTATPPPSPLPPADRGACGPAGHTPPAGLPPGHLSFRLRYQRLTGNSVDKAPHAPLKIYLVVWRDIAKCCSIAESGNVCPCRQGRGVLYDKYKTLQRKVNV